MGQQCVPYGCSQRSGIELGGIQMPQHPSAAIQPQNTASQAISQSEKIAISVSQQLRASMVLSHNRLQCRFHEGVLVLSGKVTSYYEKQMAQEIAGQATDVSLVVNQIQVQPSQ